MLIIGGLWLGGCSIEFCEDDFETKVAVSSGTYTDPEGKELLVGRPVSVTFPHAQLINSDCLDDSDPIGAGGQHGGGLGGAAQSEGGASEETYQVCSAIINGATLTFDRESGSVERTFKDNSGSQTRETWASDASSEVETDLIGCYPVETETLALSLKSVKKDDKEVPLPTAYESFNVELVWSIEGDEEGALFTASHRQNTESDPVYVYTELYPAK